MAFAKEPVRTPVAIGDISVELYHPDPGVAGLQPGANFSVQVRYSTGEIRVLTGNLVPHLTQQQIAGLVAFMQDMRQKAIAEILP